MKPPLLLLVVAACDVPFLIPAQDATPPSAVWLQADVAGQPLADVVLDGAPSSLELNELDQVVVTARADDPDGGISSLRIWSSTTRSRRGTVEGPSLAGAPEVEFVSDASVGQLGQASADVSYTFDVAPLIGSFDDVIVDVWAEAENFHGGVSTTAVLSLHVERVGLDLHVVALSNTDGTKAATVTADQFTDVVDRANRVFAGTGLILRYDPATDFETLADTGMNTDQTIFAAGNTMADAHPGEILLLLRFGGDPTNPTGNGNAYPPPGAGPKPSSVNDNDQRYVALPNVYPVGELSFLTLGNGSFVAHELGHYLGLYHTFPGWDAFLVHGTNTVGPAADQALVDYVAANGGTIDALDGDLISDTAPDPGVVAYQARSLDPCANPEITISSFTFTPPISNVMSYYGLCTTGTDPAPNTFSPDQIARMHHTLTLPARAHLVE